MDARWVVIFLAALGAVLLWTVQALGGGTVAASALVLAGATRVRTRIVPNPPESRLRPAPCFQAPTQQLTRVFPPLFLLGLLILIAPVFLLVLAHASPADPSWIPRISDDSDHDDVVTFIASDATHLALRIAFDPRPLPWWIHGRPQHSRLRSPPPRIDGCDHESSFRRRRFERGSTDSLSFGSRGRPVRSQDLVARCDGRPDL